MSGHITLGEVHTLQHTVSVAPSARRLTGSLRDIGYSFESAVADLVDNSITAGATQIDIQIIFSGRESFIRIIDDGSGMDGTGIDEAMRFGSDRNYSSGDLGRYGLGLKTASISQCRRLEIVSMTRESETHEARTLDLDFIQDTDSWVVLDTRDEDETLEARRLLRKGYGTVVTWRRLDRILPHRNKESGWARKRIENLVPKLDRHLSMVFHRFLSGERAEVLTITVNGEHLEPWDPFAREETGTRCIGKDSFEVEHRHDSGIIMLSRYLLPPKSDFSTPEAFENASGPQKWAKQQGIYIYRADRLVQWGGWAGIRTSDEHTKLARASLDFDTDLDAAFNINVAKMKVTIPHQIRKMLARPITELCIEADHTYRKKTGEAPAVQSGVTPNLYSGSRGRSESAEILGTALRSAAVRTGNIDALRSMIRLLREESPELAEQLGL
ncbi:ATP-binding protein [Corynebacterium sp. P7003]|uniref:ATP-binding protein n=1 Tax=Corynebacterium pygosceleis TaxID=2800406 RepID=A0ABT3WUN7_9CORY|nr:ATP-binding protein [Corynebacterium pygosceleis]MCX7444502.1 ATP-binding protein [Corynebacterium pygosceleis]